MTARPGAAAIVQAHLIRLRARPDPAPDSSARFAEVQAAAERRRVRLDDEAQARAHAATLVRRLGRDMARKVAAIVLEGKE